MVKRIMIIAMAISLCGCSHLDIKGIFMPTGDGVEKRFEQSMDINADLKTGTIHAQENYSFYVAADPHIDQSHKNIDIFNNTFTLFLTQATSTIPGTK